MKEVLAIYFETTDIRHSSGKLNMVSETGRKYYVILTHSDGGIIILAIFFVDECLKFRWFVMWRYDHVLLISSSKSLKIKIHPHSSTVTRRKKTILNNETGKHDSHDHKEGREAGIYMIAI